MEVVYIDIEKNITYINDSKATNATSTKAAFEAINGKKFVWIAGGLCKDHGIESLREFFHLIEKAYLIGSSCQDFYNVLTKYGVAAEKSYNLETALKSVKDCSNTTVLFSPAAASTDQWKNFEERGDYFRNNCS
jgi:UDP-N-acetylmuramoylalanine--D-glutamate ligase